MQNITNALLGGTAVPAPDPGQAVEFLQGLLGSDGSVALSAIQPDGPITTFSFELSNGPRIRRFIAEFLTDRNIYYCPSAPAVEDGKTSKPNKDGVTYARAVWIDLDPADGADLGAERARLRAVVERLMAGPMPPTAVIDSGGGYQVIWILESPVPLDGEHGPTTLRVEALNARLAAGLGGDPAVKDVCRLLRLPNTTNFPNAKKRATGRVEAPARLLHLDTDRFYTLEDLEAWAEREGWAVKSSPKGTVAVAVEDADLRDLVERLEYAKVLDVASLDDLPPALRFQFEAAMEARDRLRARWAGDGDDLAAANADTSRSGMDFSAAAMLKAAGFDPVHVAMLLRCFDHGAGRDEEKHGGRRGLLRYLARTVLRSFDPDCPAWVRAINATFFVTVDGGRTVVVRERMNDALGRKELEFIARPDFEALLANRPMVKVGERKTKKDANAPDGSTTPPEPIMRKQGPAWLEHPRRRTYPEGMELSPLRPVRPGVYNTWMGFGVTPRSGDWSLLRSHIVDIICSGREDVARWVLAWCAHLVQRPWEKPGTALVLRSETEGTGKSTFAEVLLRIAGAHGGRIDNPDDLTGRFNGRLRHLTLLHIEEAFWGGNRAAEGRLKAMITDDRQVTERKFSDAVESASFLRLVFTTNSGWAVPAGRSARRFLVADVSPARANEVPYFGRLRQEMDNGGIEAFLAYLQSLDISGVDVRNPPVTAALMEQKLRTLRGSAAWWAGVLMDAVETAEGGADPLDPLRAWAPGRWVPKETVFAAYQAWQSRRKGEWQPDDPRVFWRTMREMVPSLREKKAGSVERKPMIQFPELGEARDAFGRFMGGAVDWPGSEAAE